MRGRRSDIVARALRDDPDSWRAIVDAVGPAVLGYARSRGIADPEDVLADVLLSLVKGLRRFEGEMAGIKALALKIARDRIADRFRRGAGKHETPIADIPDRPSESAVGQEVADRDFGVRALAMLPEPQREAVYLRIICDLSAEEVGSIIGKRPGAVRVMVHRALTAIREQLDEGAVTL